MAARKSTSRREMLKLAGVGSIGLAFAPVTEILTAAVVDPRAANAAPPVDAPQPAKPTVQMDHGGAWLADLVGKRLGKYRVVSVAELHRGGIPVEMKTAKGARFRVDVLRFDPSEGARGIGELSAVSVYLRNGGKGRTATDEELGLGAMALAKELARRIRGGAVPPSGLLTMGQRSRLDASCSAPVDASLT